MNLKKSALIFLTLAVLLGAACKKAVQSVAEDFMIKLITENIWKVTSFKNGTADVTAEFSEYEFKFNKDESVNAVKNGVVVNTGTWKGSEVGQTITSTFPPTTNYPIELLTGVWKVTKTAINPVTYVTSNRTEGGVLLVMRLDKK